MIRLFLVLAFSLELDRWVSNDTPDTDTYSTLADRRSCGLYGRSFGHVLVHPWVIPV